MIARLLGDPAFWALVAAFASIWSGVVIAVRTDSILDPWRHQRAARMAFGLVSGGIAGVIAVTAAKVLA